MQTARRTFLRTSVAAGSLLILPRGLRAQGRPGPNARLQIALIGIGGRGATPLAALDQEQFVAFCDVDYGRVARMSPAIRTSAPFWSASRRPVGSKTTG
jgi:hypothetical protein